MKPGNLLSIYQGGQALITLGHAADRRYKVLKNHELTTLRALCAQLKAANCGMAELDGFFAGYAIERISKEFDLLRFGHNCIVNIELKAPLRRADKETKILRQMQANHHYLSFLAKPLYLFTFVDKDGFYAYDPDQCALRRTDAHEVAQILASQAVDPTLDPDTLFVPANYLLSPFSDTARFLAGEYFLTTSQESVKEELFRERRKTPGTCFILSAASGTGKTLLLCDIAKSLINSGEMPALVQAFPLAEAQLQFRAVSGWLLYSCTDVHPATLCSRYSFLLLDEAQALPLSQLDALACAAIASGTTLLLAFDTAPELHFDASTDCCIALTQRHPALPLSAKALSTKIRANSILAAFIANLFHSGSATHHPANTCVWLDYLYEADDLRATCPYLTEQGWTLLTSLAAGPGIPLENNITTNLRHAGSMEFDKVAVILDRRFFYDPAGHLQTSDPTNNALRDLYRIVTRATEQLRLIIYNNPPLYLELLKHLEAD